MPASPGQGTLSFFAVLFSDARIASIRIRTGDEEPGNDDDDVDIVMMDDFIYGEPKVGGGTAGGSLERTDARQLS